MQKQKKKRIHIDTLVTFIFSFIIIVIPFGLIFRLSCHEKANKKQCYETIIGVPVSVDYIAADKFTRTTIVKFADGTVRAFREISYDVFKKGKVNIINVNCYKQILSVEVKQ